MPIRVNLIGNFLSMLNIIRNKKAELKYYREIPEEYMSHENFHDMLYEDGGQHKLSEKENSIVCGTITAINKDYILLDIGLKSEGQVPIKEFSHDKENGVDLQIGNTLNVHLTKIEGGDGTVVLSRENAIKCEKWDSLHASYENNEDVPGAIAHKIKSGYIVDLGLIAAFLPNSHVDLKPVKDISELLNKKIKFRILKMDRSQGNIVVSRRAILDSLHAQARKDFLCTLEEGQTLEGTVKSITNYGVFVGLFESPEIGVVDGLLHITDISWSRISHPSAIYTCGQKITVKIINIDKELNRISLGKKQLVDNPWHNLEKKYPINEKFSGQVTSIEEYGVFVELEPGIEGLVHSSEISWMHNAKVSFTRGNTVEVMVLSIDIEKNRMSLSIKKCNDNPWKKFIDQHPLGSVVECKIKTINLHSGMNVEFIGYAGNVSGFIHNRDVSWDDKRQQALKQYKVGSTIDAKVLRFNAVKGGIFLGIKQINYDPFAGFLSTLRVGEKVVCVISKIEDNGIYVIIKEDIDRFIERDNLSDMSGLSIGERINLEVKEIFEYNIVLSDKTSSDAESE